MKLNLSKVLMIMNKKNKGFVVLTAAIIGLAIALLLLIANSATDKSDGVGARLETQEISTYN